MIPMDSEGNILPLSQDTKRHFLYTRYNADLGQEALNKLGLNHIKSEQVREMDSVKYINELQEVGRATAEAQVDISHFGSFVN